MQSRTLVCLAAACITASVTAARAPTSLALTLRTTLQRPRRDYCLNPCITKADCGRECPYCIAKIGHLCSSRREWSDAAAAALRASVATSHHPDLTEQY
ncbi:hypothetical protein DFH09DRAFT_1210763 [Mycena vulgaris]|nr:hypothetical protein DFH09DRAFT_1210763 [Mycena vulgaris]